MYKQGDILLAGNRRFIIERVKGNAVLLVWNEDGSYREMWTIISKIPRLVKFNTLQSSLRGAA